MLSTTYHTHHVLSNNLQMIFECTNFILPIGEESSKYTKYHT